MDLDPLDRLITVSKRYPMQPALVENRGSVSYSTFVEHLAKIAHLITGAPSSHPKVLIHLPQGYDAYASMFATLMAGGYYSCSNFSLPLERQLDQIRLFDPDVVVTSRDELIRIRAALGSNAITILPGETLPEKMLMAPRKAHDLAYVMFTSGSSGKPKGVMIRRGGLANYTNWAIESMQVSVGDRWSQHPNISFDLSVLDIYGALCAGATLYPISDAKERLFLGKFIKQHQLTIWNSVPSVVSLMAQSGQLTPENMQSVRMMTFCGEPLFREHLDRIFEANPKVLVHNTYGPTEATVSCTLIRLNRENYLSACGNSVALGEPISGMDLKLANGASPDEGEIILTGIQVAAGYWQDQATTAAKFHKNTFRTGDWGERRNGNLYFVERIDNQVKVRGHRVELDGINAAIRGMGIGNCATIQVGEALHCFLEVAPSTDMVQLKESLAKKLTTYEMPNFFHSVDCLPRNANDKVDTLKLKAMVLEAT